MRTLDVRVEHWPLARTFSTSGVSADAVTLVAVSVRDGDREGRGEAAGIYYRGETAAVVAAQIEAVRGAVEAGLDRAALQSLLPPGGARNALDCALWELEARSARCSVAALLRLVPGPVPTLATISLDSPAAMAAEARERRAFRVLKLKLGADDPVARVLAVRAVRPDARLIADANGAWRAAEFAALADDLAAAGLEMVEQPCSPAEDAALQRGAYALDLCADESCHDRADLERVAESFDVVNVKLDKTGGLTEALALASEARRRGLEVVIGNMLGTCLAMAPVSLLAPQCRYVDIDGPLLLAADRPPGLQLAGDVVAPLVPSVWG